MVIPRAEHRLPGPRANADWRVGNARPEPKPEEIEENDREYETENGKYRDADKIKSVHGRKTRQD